MIHPLAHLKQSARRLVRRGRPVVLMYHRVARLAQDPWQLAVTTEHFAEQIECLVRRRRVVPLRTLAQALADGRAPRGWVAITFDDGYADVFENARPILERHDCPATVFITSGAIGSGREFWWDRLVRIVLEAPALPGTLALEIAGSPFRWNLAPESGPEALHRALWHRLRVLDPEYREAQLDGLSDWAGVERAPRSADLPMTAEQVAQLGRGQQIEIGAHCITHPSLPALSVADQQAEITGSRRACEALIGAPVTSFAYPFGDLDATSVEMVRAAGFSTACTTRCDMIKPDNDLLQLPRVAVPDWSGEEFERRLARDISTS